MSPDVKSTLTQHNHSPLWTTHYTYLMFVMNTTTARQTSIIELSVSNYKHKQQQKQQNIQNDYFSTDSPLTGILHFWQNRTLNNNILKNFTKYNCLSQCQIVLNGRYKVIWYIHIIRLSEGMHKCMFTLCFKKILINFSTLIQIHTEKFLIRSVWY